MTSPEKFNFLNDLAESTILKPIISDIPAKRLKAKPGGFAKVSEEYFECLNEVRELYLSSDESSWDLLKYELVDLYAAVEYCMVEMFGIPPSKLRNMSDLKQRLREGE